MSTFDARAAVVSALSQIAPELGTEEIQDPARLRQDLDLDSLDFLRLVEQISDTTGVDIPERDYPRVATVGGLVAYLSDKHVG